MLSVVDQSPVREGDTAGDDVRPSHERLLHVVVAPCDLVDDRTRAPVLVLDVSANRPSLALEQLQHFMNRRVTGTPGNVGARFSYSPATRGLAAPLGEM